MNQTTQPKGLGKGLSALMGEDYGQANPTSYASASPVSVPKEGLQNLRVELVHSGNFQPRRHFDEQYLKELAESIEKNGIMQPIIVRPSLREAGQYEIIAGERRWRACKLAKLATIPAIIRDIDDQLALELALVENIQRKDLTVLEEANGYQRLMDEFGYTQEELSNTVGKSRSHIANLLRLLSLPDSIKPHLESGDITMGHARALLNAEDPEKHVEKIMREGLNVRQTELLVRRGEASSLEGRKSRDSQQHNVNRNGYHTPPREKDADILALEETLSETLGLKVSINDRGNQQGEVVICYEKLTQLDEILRRLGNSF